MPYRKPSIDDDGEVREITTEDVALFKLFSKLPQDEQTALLNLRNRSSAETEVSQV
jgi:hypothetical protein